MKSLWKVYEKSMELKSIKECLRKQSNVAQILNNESKAANPQKELFVLKNKTRMNE